MRLAIPALGALIAEPLFLLADSALVGHLGVVPLAGLGIASVVLQTIIGLLVFLAYATTPAVARRLGAGDERGGVSVGVDGMWLALGLGAVLAAVGALLSPSLVALFRPDAAVAAAATTYLSISMAGLPAMLVVFAATGLLRGLQDTRTPLVVAVAGFGANAALNALLIYGAGWGIAGSAWGTVLAQWGMVAAYVVVVVRHARRTGAVLRPQRDGIRSSALSGGWLLLRTAALRAALVIATVVATGIGTAELAGFHVVLTVFSTLAFALDALAIAAQALVGRGLGAGDVGFVRSVLRRCLVWGVGGGAILGVALAAVSGVAGLLFTGSADTAALIAPSLVIVAIGTPLAGYVFVLDGVLIGAGDARYLALTGLVNLAVFVPLAVAASMWGGAGAVGLAWLTAAFALGYIAARATTLGLRSRGTAWQRIGV